jgi:hypothetical protein
MDADQVLRSAGRRSPGLVRLALLLCPAVQIEPELMRTVRLELVPKLPAGAEGELWFSPLVSARGLDGVVLDADVANLLRSRARAILLLTAGTSAADDMPARDDMPAQDDMPARDDIGSAWRLIEQMHAASPPVLRLEERVNWLAISEANPQARIEAELQLAVEALRRGRTGVARWAARALPRMPDAARSTTAAWLLAQSAGRRLASREWGTRAPDIASIDDLAELLPPRYDVPLGVRRFGDRLDIGDVGREGVSVRVLDTDPRVIAVSDTDRVDEQIIQVSNGARVSVDVGPGPVLLRTPRGELYRVEADDVVAELRRSCVSVQSEGPRGQALTMGIAVAPDRVLTLLSTEEISGPITITGSSGDLVTAEMLATEGMLALLQVTQLPAGVQPTTLPSARPSPSLIGARWYGLTFDSTGSWLAVTGEITGLSLGAAGIEEGPLTVTLDTPGVFLMAGSPVLADGALCGVITSRSNLGLTSSEASPSSQSEASPSSQDVYTVETAAVAHLRDLGQEPDRLSRLTSAAEAIALEFHLRFEGFRRGSRTGESLTERDTDALMSAAGLAPDQLQYVRGAAEYVIKAGVEARTQPRWLLPSGSSRFSAAVTAALDEASEALDSLARRQRSISLGSTRFSLTAAAQEGLAEAGITFVPSASGGVYANLDADRFTAGGLRRLRAVLADELPRFDEWDPWSAAPAAGAERPQVLLEVIGGLCRSVSDVPEPARTALAGAGDHLYPQWWQVRDGLVQVGVPDLDTGQNFPDFLEAYLGWCLTVLHQVGISLGDLRYEMGFRIPLRGSEALPTARFGLEKLPAPNDDEVFLAGRFSALVGFSAWVFLELADQVRLAAAQPPLYPVLVPSPQTPA